MWTIKLISIIFFVPIYCFSSSEIQSNEFGKIIGQSYLTSAYSNYDSELFPKEYNFVPLNDTSKNVFSGLKWQCVEYARRWLIKNKNITFAEVQYAYEIWNLNHGERIDTGEPIRLIRFENKISNTKPQVGDLLIYSSDFAITGHVAVVVSVDNKNSITIAEQNYFNKLWDVPNFSRRLLLGKNEKGQYHIFDEYLIGWIRFN
jgi:hypothetical protein